jgi:mannose-6-phosphate isomerase
LIKENFLNSTTLEIDTPLLLEPAVQNYAWGKVGEESLVAQLLPDFSAQLPYAELWFGDHQRAPAKVIAAGQRVALDQLISQYPVEILGSHLIAQFGAKLPFLFKVLSVKQSLSIQAHPDRELARVLHAQKPAHYPDDNHKPEIAIALSAMRLLYGFKTLKQISSLVSVTPELEALVGNDLVLELQNCRENEEREYLKKLFSKIVKTPQDQLSKYGSLLVQRIRSLTDLSREQELTLELAQLYGAGDVGIFSSCLMNFCELKPGEAVYIGPNIPHAYLSGDMIECMANSDNVVRAGLTPKFQDTETLISMLTYESGPLTPIKSESTNNAGLRVFATPTKEFALYEIIGINPLAIGTAGFPAIVFCLQGNAQVQAGGKTINISRGKAAIIPAFLDDRMVTLEQSSRAFLVTVPA